MDNKDEILRRLISAFCAEKQAEYLYKWAEVFSLGTGYTASAEIVFGPHAKEERKHAERFAERIMQLGGTVPFDPADWVKYTFIPYPCECEESRTTQWVTDRIFEAEDATVAFYIDLANLTAECDPATNNMVCDILEDENHHRAETAKLKVEIDGEK